MNRRILSVGVFMVLMLSSLLAGRQGYCGAKEAITADLNQALLRMFEERAGGISSRKTPSGHTSGLGKCRTEKYGLPLPTGSYAVI